MAELLAQAVSDGEIAAACVSLGLPALAFHGADGDDARLAVLRSNGSIDVAACPGSGKTTLLVAKLAILAKRWTLPASGLCVLSHTNVARLEIEKRLGSDTVGRTILSYPHFVGTIHGFVNQFIALPWLRSQGINVVTIDDDICIRRRLHKLTPPQRSHVLQTNRGADLLRIVDANHDVGNIRWGSGPLGKHTATYQAFVSACEATTAEGYFCHDDMMIWAAQALDRNPDLRGSVRQRFPVLFLDEVQDNDDVQAAILHSLFMEGDQPVVRQRFGDMNQAIYGSASATDGNGNYGDVFPNAAISIPVANSHRFGPQIATLADGLALSPPGLIGLRGHSEAETGRQAAILLFGPEQAATVLPAFAHLLTTRFSPAELAAGLFAAVGAIHRDTNRPDKPNCVAHYWDGYDHELARIEGRPSTLIGYLRRGIRDAAGTGDVRPIAERAADAVLRLATILNTSVRHPNLGNRFRQLGRLLEHDAATLRRFHLLCWKVASGDLPTDAEVWQTWKKPISDIACALLAGAAAGSADNFWRGKTSADRWVPLQRRATSFLTQAWRLRFGSRSARSIP